MVLKYRYFPKNYEIPPSGWGLRPQNPVCNTFELQYTSLLNTRRPVETFLYFNYWLRANTRPRLLIFHSTISFPPRKIPFSKFLMMSLHVICGLGPPQSKILASTMTQVSLVVFPLLFFNCFQQLPVISF